MKIHYYPGCTLKTKAKNLEIAAVASLEKLGVEVVELERWNCCGAVFSLTDDDLIHMVGPVRNLIRAKEQGADKLMTLCSMCYNTLARANELMKNDQVKRDTINRFMDEEIDYNGEVEVVHYLTYLKDEIGWETLKQKVTNPIDQLNVSPYYGCTLQRPADVGIEPFGSYELMGGMLEAIGAQVIHFRAADKCCGSYQVVADQKAANKTATVITQAATAAGADVIATSCPLCEYNLAVADSTPTFYFTQLLAMALGVERELCHFSLNSDSTNQILSEKCQAA